MRPWQVLILIDLPGVQYTRHVRHQKAHLTGLIKKGTPRNAGCLSFFNIILKIEISFTVSLCHHSNANYITGGIYDFTIIFYPDNFSLVRFPHYKIITASCTCYCASANDCIGSLNHYRKGYWEFMLIECRIRISKSPKTKPPPYLPQRFATRRFVFRTMWSLVSCTSQ